MRKALVLGLRHQLANRVPGGENGQIGAYARQRLRERGLAL